MPHWTGRRTPRLESEGSPLRVCARLAVAALLLSCLAAPALAKYRFGARGGANLSAFGGEFADIVQPDPRVAPSVAFVYEHEFVPKLSFRLEAGYSGKGGTKKSDGTDPLGNVTTFTDTWRFEYFEVPMLFRGRLVPVAGATPFVEMGVSVGCTLSGKLEEYPRFLRVTDLGHSMQPVDYGWAAGTGVEFAAGPGRIGIEARFTRGFGDLFDLENNAPAINQAWTLSLSYMR